MIANPQYPADVPTTRLPLSFTLTLQKGKMMQIQGLKGDGPPAGLPTANP